MNNKFNYSHISIIVAAILLFLLNGCANTKSESSNEAITSNSYSSDVNQSTYTLTATDVTIENGIITSSTLTSVTGNNYKPKIIIPERLDGQLVRGIGENAFRDKSLSSVILPNGLTFIGEGAFKYNSITSVTLPIGLTSIQNSAFESNNITNVSFPPGLTSIEGSAFRDNSLAYVDLPDGLTKIGDFAFQNNRLAHLTLPPRLKTIEESAFNVNFLINVDLPAGLTTIEESAFRDNRLTSIDFPEKLTTIGQKAFLANRLIHIDLPTELKYIGEHTFSSNSGLASFILPKYSTIDNSGRWQSSNGKVLDAEYVITSSDFGNSYKAIEN